MSGTRHPGCTSPDCFCGTVCNAKVFHPIDPPAHAVISLDESEVRRDRCCASCRYLAATNTAVCSTVAAPGHVMSTAPPAAR